MKCYFCQNDIELQPDHSKGPYRVRISENCQHCSQTHNVHEVITTFKEDGSPDYVHIYPEKQEYGMIYGSSNIPGSHISYPKNKTFHIRLNLDEKTTYIGLYGAEHIMTLPGLSIKPENAKEKLKLYLLFS